MARDLMAELRAVLAVDIATCLCAKCRDARHTGEHVACVLCGHGTWMVGARRCDQCHELELRIEVAPEIARAVLRRVDQVNGLEAEHDQHVAAPSSFNKSV